jgi:probable HAF family extracellular repeat protein
VNGTIQQLRRLAGGVCLAMTTSALAMIGGASPVAAGGGVPPVYHAFVYSANTGMMTDLGTLPGRDQSRASDINDLGQVVGVSFNDTGFTAAFVWSASTGMQDVNNLLPSNSGWALVSAEGISNSGLITGSGTFNGQVQHAYLLTPAGVGTSASIVDLGQLFTAVAINNTGKVAGIDCSIACGAAVYGAGTFTQLGTPAGSCCSRALEINDSAQVAGDAAFPAPAPVNQEQHALLYSGGSILDLGAGSALGINNAGQVVGGRNVATGHAFLYSAGTTTDLGTLPGASYSEAEGINDTLQIVGYASMATGDLHGFLYRAGAMVDVGTLPGRTNSIAHRINAAGQVAGTSWGAATVTTTTMRQDINQLLASGAIKNAGIANSLIAKLNAVETARAIGDCATAASIAQAFINELQAQGGKSVVAAAASTLIADAQFLIAHCP